MIHGPRAPRWTLATRLALTLALWECTPLPRILWGGHSDPWLCGHPPISPPALKWKLGLRPKVQKSFIGKFRPIRDTVSKPGTPEHPAPAWDSLHSSWPPASDSLKTQRLPRAPKPGKPLPASHQLAFLSENFPISLGAIGRFEHFLPREEIFFPLQRAGGQRERQTDNFSWGERRLYYYSLL